MLEISASFERISGGIESAAHRSGRKPNEITLVAASKKIPLERIREAAQAGISVFGENRVQEGVSKFQKSDFVKEIESLHLIGPLQSNKVKKAVGLFALIHSIDSLPLAERIDREAARRDLKQTVLVQVNVGGEASKHGVSVKETARLVDSIQVLPHLSLLGLMVLPPFASNPEETRPYFAKLRELGSRVGLDRFSMGMSSDYEVAIEEGATWIRIGTALFGKRER